MEVAEDGFRILSDKGEFLSKECVISVGRSGSKWMETVCRELPITSEKIAMGLLEK